MNKTFTVVKISYTLLVFEACLSALHYKWRHCMVFPWNCTRSGSFISNFYEWSHGHGWYGKFSEKQFKLVPINSKHQSKFDQRKQHCYAGKNSERGAWISIGVVSKEFERGFLLHSFRKNRPSTDVPRRFLFLNWKIKLGLNKPVCW